jgi:hypothetical protein
LDSVFIPIPVDQARERFQQLPRLASGFRLEFIPAQGGCVVAAVPTTATVTAGHSSLRQKFLPLRQKFLPFKGARLSSPLKALATEFR